MIGIIDKYTFLEGKILIKYSGSGKSLDDPIVIEGAKNNFEGIRAEYMYIEEKYGRRNVDWRLLRQALLESNNKIYDKLAIELKSGDVVEIYFDITNFFGKL